MHSVHCSFHIATVAPCFLCMSCVGYVDHLFLVLLDFICIQLDIFIFSTVSVVITVRCTPGILHSRLVSCHDEIHDFWLDGLRGQTLKVLALSNSIWLEGVITYDRHVSDRVEIEYMCVLENGLSSTWGEATKNTDYKDTLLFTSWINYLIACITQTLPSLSLGLQSFIHISLMILLWRGEIEDGCQSQFDWSKLRDAEKCFFVFENVDASGN